MNKLIGFTSALIASAAISHGAFLVSAWDFHSLEYTDGSISADLFDRNTDLDGPGMSSGTLYFNGQSGSTNLLDDAESFPGDITVPYANVNDNYSLTSYKDRQFTNLDSTPAQAIQLLTSADGSSIVFATSTTGYALGYTDYTLTYAANVLSGSTTITWEYSTNGSSWTVAGINEITALSGNNDADVNSVALGSGVVSDEIYFRATFSSMDSLLNIDNVVISANAAVPEPSTYAGIAGGLALAFVALRRRLRK
ncbi:MAG: PEP-CTERM sorting domain-containing protein [Verrucomicrobiota bacterium JB024]|nr:PEP-CTERM sorting domain-containing protein [Verrucomicrobiota bacterium JB024]